MEIVDGIWLLSWWDHRLCWHRGEYARILAFKSISVYIFSGDILMIRSDIGNADEQEFPAWSLGVGFGFALLGIWYLALIV